MDAGKRNAVALNKRVDDICNSFMEHYLRIVAAAADPASTDYSATAQNELSIVAQQQALVQDSQDLSSLMRDLRELWLFGGLDTLADADDEKASREKALEIAGLVERLARAGAATESAPGAEDDKREV